MCRSPLSSLWDTLYCRRSCGLIPDQLQEEISQDLVPAGSKTAIGDDPCGIRERNWDDPCGI